MNSTGKEPWIRLVHREEISSLKKWMFRILFVVIGLLVSALFLNNITQLNPIAVFGSMFKGAFGTEKRIWVTFKDMSLLLCVAIALAPAFKMKFWNVGAEGQILMGGLVSAACMIHIGDRIPNGLLLILMAILAMVAGAIWGLIPAIFKAKYRTNETLFTLMMNYIALQLVEFYIDIWDKKQSHSVGVINSSTKAGWLPQNVFNQYFLIVLIVLLLAVFMYIYLARTKQGFEISVVGESESTARYAGISVSKVMLRTMLISGGIAGLAGFLEVSGVSHTISSSTAGGRGFTAIIVAWLAKFNSFGMILITLLLSFLNRGANQIASDFNFNKYGSEIITGIILFFILASEFMINYRIVFRKSQKGGSSK